MSNPTILPALDGWREAPAAVRPVVLHRTEHGLHSAQTDKEPTVYTGVEKGAAGSESGIRASNLTPTAPADPPTAPADQIRGRCGIAWLLGQVVLFLGFDGVMLTVANDHRVQMMMFSLFDLCPGRPAQGVYEVETSCFAAELFALDLLL